MTCPICQKEGHPSYRPFCSRRCADIDLAYWLNGSYTIQTEEPATFADSVVENDAQLPH